MKNLIEISKIVTKRKVKKIEIFDDHSLKHKNSKFNEFYEALTANKFKNDRDAATFLYGCSPTDAKYRQLKSRFKKRLLNTLFFLDVNKPSTSTYERAYFSCNKDWTLIKILNSNNAYHTAASQARQTLTTALKFSFADVIVNCSRILCEYASRENDEKSYEEYIQYVKEYSGILEAEMQSEEIYQRVIMSYYRPQHQDDDFVKQLSQYCDDLVTLSERFDSPVIYYNMYQVWIMRYEMAQDFDAVLEVCNQAESYIQENPNYYQEEKLISFHTKKMSAYLHLKDYKKGKVNAEKCLNSFSEGSQAWFTFMEYYYLLAIHTEQYIHALAIINKALANSKFKKLDNTTKEKWKIFEYYMNFIIEHEGQHNPILKKQKRKSFRLSKFLNSNPLYPKEQRIFTLHLLIIQVMFLINNKSYNEADEQVDRLKNYANRQLKKDLYHRVIQFIRLLQQASRSGYKEENLSNPEKYLNRLKKKSFVYRGALAEMEVIPYEKVWKILLDYM